MLNTVVIRVDSSVHLSAGHVMRCLNLAEALRLQGIKVIFICQELPGNSIGLLEKNKFEVYRLPNEAESAANSGQVIEILEKIGTVHCLIVDHYGLDIQWEQAVRPFIQKLFVIDDQANRKHHCDILLDQNFYFNKEFRYKNLVPETCLQLLGPQYALLKSDFSHHRKSLRDREGSVKKILISFGGSDETNATAKAIAACSQVVNSTVEIDVIVGASNPHQQSLTDLCAKFSNIHYAFQVNNMAEFIANADLAIGAGGITTWERCCLGLPSLVITNALNQEEPTTALSALGAIHYIGRSEDVSMDQISASLDGYLNKPEKLRTMSVAGRELVDGYGCPRVVEQLNLIEKFSHV